MATDRNLQPRIAGTLITLFGAFLCKSTVYDLLSAHPDSKSRPCFSFEGIVISTAVLCTGVGLIIFGEPGLRRLRGEDNASFVPNLLTLLAIALPGVIVAFWVQSIFGAGK